MIPLSLVGQPVDAVPEAVICWWSGDQPATHERHRLPPQADGGWRAVQDPATGDWVLGLE